MSAAEVTITGVLYDKVNRTTQNVVLIGEASLTGVGIGGGPIIPEPQPPGIWPSPGHPAHPIAPGRPGGGERPSHPIYRPGPGGPVDPGWGVEGPGIPPKPTEPPPDGGDKPPPEDGGWGFVSEWSAWGYFPASDEAQPKG